jgi:chromosome partitioning protein
MNVITVASRKGGAGKTTICAHLAGHAHALGRRALLIDADPQGSLALCNSLRASAMPFTTAERGIDRPLAMATVEGIEWVFIDTAPTMWVVVQEAIRAATLVLIPARPGFLDLAAVRETVKCARERDRPYAVVLNACPVKRGVKEAPAVAQSRAYLTSHEIPVWSGQISQRAGFVLSLADGASTAEGGAESPASAEMSRLWHAVEKSVEAVNAARASVAGTASAAGTAGVHGQAA